MPEWPRAILHVDLDAFYASVEQLRRPELRGKPVIVGGAADAEGRPVMGRGVVSAASYEVRAYGVHSAMPLGQALRLCPNAVVVPVDFVAYRKASSDVFDVLRQVTPVIEPLSLDEAYLDVTGSIALCGPPPAIATDLRDAIYDATGLHASFGVAGTKTVAKIASDLRKPRGMVVVPPGEEAAFLAPLPLRRLPGLGPATEHALAGLGVATLGQLAALPQEVVVRRLGTHAGNSVWLRSRGVDGGEVTVPGVAKSISREQTFDHDLSDGEHLRDRLRHLCDDVGARLRQTQHRAHTITLKLRYADFTTLSRQQTLPTATDSDQVILAASRSLFDGVWSGAPVRLLGMGVGSLEDAAQLDLFGDTSPRAGLDSALDEIRARFGPRAAQRGTGGDLRDLDFRGDDMRRLGTPT